MKNRIVNAEQRQCLVAYSGTKFVAEKWTSTYAERAYVYWLRFDCPSRLVSPNAKMVIDRFNRRQKYREEVALKKRKATVSLTPVLDVTPHKIAKLESYGIAKPD